MKENNLAQWLPNEKKLLELKKRVIISLEKKEIFTGKEFGSIVEGILEKNLIEPFIYLCISKGILTKLKSGHAIKDYQFSFNTPEFEKYMESQIVAAEIISSIKPIKKSNDSCVELLVTYPEDPNISKLSSFKLLYPTLKNMVDSAEHQILIINPFFDIGATTRFIQDILYALKRGIKIKIITREYFAGHTELIKSIKCLIKKIEEQDLGNLEIRDYFEKKADGTQKKSVHAKVMVIDEKEAYVGSANITTASLSYNLEIGVKLSNDEVKELSKLFYNIWSASKPIDLDDLHQEQ